MGELNSNDLLERLRRKFDEPEWIVLSEVRNGTGFKRQPRSADALAFSTYPSRGLSCYGFEFKVSRNDWLRELKNPDKSVAMQERCDRWYVVVSDPDIIKPGELPAAWGLMVPFRDGLKTVVESKTHDPGPWPRDFVASMLRNAMNTGSAKDQAEARTAFDKGYKAGVAYQEQSDRSTRGNYQALSESVRKFEDAAGIHIDRYGNDHRIADLAKKVKAARAFDLEGHTERADHLANSLENIAKQLRAAVENAKVSPVAPQPTTLSE